MDKVALTPEVEPIEVHESQPESSIRETGEHIPLFDLFGGEKDNHKLNDIYGQIWEWGKDQAPNKDTDSIKFEIIRLKNRLGSPTIGERSYHKVMMFIKTSKEIRQREQRLKELEYGSI